MGGGTQTLTGEYYTAFFGLSVGLERLAKLVLVADHAISHSGQMPDEKLVRKFGHKIGLMNAVDAAAQQHKLKLDFRRPTTVISTKIIECLDAFADSGRGRYANFAALGDPNLGREEPISKWWGEVAELILKEHYYGKNAQRGVEARAKAIDTLMSPFAMVHHINETGTVMQDVLSASVSTGQTDIVQRHGRYYALTVIRWLADVFSGYPARSALAAQRRCVLWSVGVFPHLHSRGQILENPQDLAFELKLTVQREVFLLGGGLEA